jgi:cytochrome bd-type quinol oxidase subunit 2
MQNKSHIKKGLIIAVILIAFNAITHFTKTYFDEWTNFVVAAITIAGIILSVYLFSKEEKNNLRFSELFSYGFKTAAAVACICFVYNLLAVYFFFPYFIKETLIRKVALLKNTAPFDEKVFQQNIHNGIKVEQRVYFALTLMITLFLGIIGSLIGAVAAPKKTQQQN